MNTKAKHFLKDLDVDEISMTLGTGSATQKNDEKSYLLKRDDIELSLEEQELLEEILKADTDVVLELTFQEFLSKFLNIYCDDAMYLCNLLGYEYDDSYPMSMEEAKSQIDDRMNHMHLIKADDMSLAQKLFMKGVQVDFEKASKTVNGKSIPKTEFAYTPSDNVSEWKLPISTSGQASAAVAALGEGFRGQKVEIPSKDLKAVKAKVKTAYKKFFPDNDVPDVIKSMEEKDSDVISESQVNENLDDSDNNVIKHNEDVMTDKVDAPEVTSTQLEELQKSNEAMLKANEDMLKLVKSLEDRAEKAEKEKEAVQKAAKDAEIAKAKEDLTEVVKGWESLENTAEVVEALFKSDECDVLIKAMNTLNERVETLKKSFGEEEHGADVEVVIKDDFSKAQESVRAILAKNKAKTKK